MRKLRIGQVGVALTLAVVAGVGVPGIAEASPGALAEQFVTAGETRGDYVHLSRTTSMLAASAHGWWTWPEPTDLKARVTVQLQVNRGGTWVDAGPPGSEVTRPGTGGSGRRANAFVVCATSVNTEWRSVVDVDIIGRLDSPNKLYTASRPLNCGV
ncbi:hypothetical protein [Actinomycetospora soli]|uniref:hypothetical protein n=1 Tax=Actinomycetospora soli TaxID=2893887 RepID=UPI001E563541|nr:hypothetical protein [Actinomycetospora soli]MCD2186611.1 hypothetical protein [Actinomycetospora soli]